MRVRLLPFSLSLSSSPVLVKGPNMIFLLKQLAKLEITILVANFVGMFDFLLCDAKGRHMSEAPETNRSNHTSSGPDTPVRLKYKLREQQ